MLEVLLLVRKDSNASFSINDNNLVGYSSKSKKADKFGSDAGGVSARHVFESQEVVLHHDLWPPDFEDERPYRDEFEFLVIGGKRSFDIKDLKVRGSKKYGSI